MPRDIISLSEHRYMRIEWSDGLTQADIDHVTESLELFIKKLPRFLARESGLTRLTPEPLQRPKGVD